jgi:hypothetical protein
MCKSCVSDALDKKSSAPNLFNQIVRYLDLIIGSAIVCLLAFFTIFFFLMGASGAGYLGILFCAAAAIGLYYDYKRKKYSTGYSVLTIVLYGVLLVIVIAGIFAIAAFIL